MVPWKAGVFVGWDFVIGRAYRSGFLFFTWDLLVNFAPQLFKNFFLANGPLPWVLKYVFYMIWYPTSLVKSLFFRILRGLSREYCSHQCVRIGRFGICYEHGLGRRDALSLWRRYSWEERNVFSTFGAGFDPAARHNYVPDAYALCAPRGLFVVEVAYGTHFRVIRGVCWTEPRFFNKRKQPSMPTFSFLQRPYTPDDVGGPVSWPWSDSSCD